MKILNFFLLSTLFLWTVASCSSDSEDSSFEEPVSYEQSIEVGDSAARTCLVYIVADNNLNAFVKSDLKEMLVAATSIPSDCYMLAYVDDRQSSRILRFFNNNGVGDSVRVYDFGCEMASCDTVYMRKVVEWVQCNCPAKKMDLVFWSHGSGWLYDDNERRPTLYSFGRDDEGGDTHRTNIEEIAGLLRSLSLKPERVFFDACFMQGVECAYAFRNSADWVIASPAEVPGYGAPYHKVLPLIFDPSAGIQTILEAYEHYYEGSGTGVVLSAVRCSAMEGLANAVSVAVKGHLTPYMGADYDALFAYLPGGSWGYIDKFPNFYDINSVMLRYLPYDEYVAFKKALDEAVPYKCGSDMWVSDLLPSKNSKIYLSASWCGLSMYLPRDIVLYPKGFNESFAYTEWYKAAGWEEVGW